ncbi:hypothetical protein LBMAG27_06150 [Bacteroidota bacterium]|nr:hypothetical protein LBMAG27_06150 [Bacteroidota bacterium]
MRIAAATEEQCDDGEEAGCGKYFFHLFEFVFCLKICLTFKQSKQLMKPDKRMKKYFLDDAGIKIKAWK